MRFKDIEGQRILINHLTEIIDSGRVSHAQLLLGPSSSGSLALAIAYAQYLNCENRQHYHGESDLRADSCGECPTCKKYQQLMHTDLHFVFPTATTSSASSSPCSNEFIEQFREFLNNYHQTGTEDQWYEHLGIEKKQGMIRERDVDNIVRELGLKSYEGSYKVLIMWMAERMNIVAANKLLKTLEEPTDRTVILMVAESRDRMLSTILSRVQQIVVPGQGIEVAGSRRVEYAAMFVSWMRLLFKLNMQTLSAWVDKAAELGREPLKLFLKFAQESVRACYLKTAAGVELNDELAFGDEKFNSSFPAMITNNNVEQICNALNEAQYSIERNAYAKITLMQLSFRLSKAIKNR